MLKRLLCLFCLVLLLCCPLSAGPLSDELNDITTELEQEINNLESLNTKINFYQAALEVAMKDLEKSQETLKEVQENYLNLLTDYEEQQKRLKNWKITSLIISGITLISIGGITIYELRK